MTSAWAAVSVSAVIAAAGLGAIIARISYRAGRVEEAIDRLTRLAERHDDQIRDLTRSRR
jgi:hypothetical protein